MRTRRDTDDAAARAVSASPRAPGARLACLLALALAAAGCARELNSLADANALRNALIREYEHQGINVTVQDGTYLGIQFINSRFNALDDAGRRGKAREIALFARGHFPSISRIARIWVTFLEGETRLYVFHSYRTLGVFAFDKDRVEAGDLDSIYERGRASAGARSEGVELRAAAAYDATRDETRVSINHLQLYGDLDDGLILMPEFVVSGRKLRAPESVDFEFISYSKRLVFAGDRRLTLVVDGARVATKKPRLATAGRGADGTYSEVISHRLSYKEFLRLVDGREIKLRLGSKEIEPGEENLRLLREMKACVDDGRCP
jgi:hypothetical protein